MKKLNQKGFTLVELMVVVAIIGILSAIAVPNFKKYQAKSKQSEAKLTLAGIFTAETAIFAEYDSFFSCLLQIGYEPGAAVAGQTGGYYAAGTTGMLVNAVAGGQTPAGCAGGAGNETFDATKVTGGGGAPATAAAIPAAAVTATDTFIAGVGGQVMAGGQCDQWTINENKTVTNTQSGLMTGAVCP
ncbi:MAG: prepilin-type N-terminal cleavage/methylation domain-containing protein [Bacteriovoracaceae bacterium]|nr:prepilin-type N-terminal cleavage/methylation domain-containing protein [Bacteriovoracaceae bacterium]